MFRLYYQTLRDFNFSYFNEHQIIDNDLVEIAKDVKKMLEAGKTVEEVEKILYKEYYGFEEGERFIEIEDKTIILRNEIGEAVKILLIDFEKELEKIEKELKEWLYQYSVRQIFEVSYNRWQDGGFSWIIDEVAIGEVEFVAYL